MPARVRSRSDKIIQDQPGFDDTTLIINPKYLDYVKEVGSTHRPRSAGRRQPTLRALCQADCRPSNLLALPSCASGYISSMWTSQQGREQRAFVVCVHPCRSLRSTTYRLRISPHSRSRSEAVAQASRTQLSEGGPSKQA